MGEIIHSSLPGHGFRVIERSHREPLRLYGLVPVLDEPSPFCTSKGQHHRKVRTREELTLEEQESEEHRAERTRLRCQCTLHDRYFRTLLPTAMKVVATKARECAPLGEW